MHNLDIAPVRLLNKLYHDLSKDRRYEIFIMFETSLLQKVSKLEIANINVSEDHIFNFTWEEMIEKYHSKFYGKAYVGNCCYPFIELWHRLEEHNSHYDYFIFVEDDILYTGDYVRLFDTIKVNQYDCVRFQYNHFPTNWYWYKDQYINKDTRRTVIFPFCKIHKGLLQLYSLSNKAMSYLYDKLTFNVYLAHHELLINTLLDNNDELTKHFYDQDLNTHIYVYKDELRRYIEHHSILENELYHPIKNDLFDTFDQAYKI